MIDFYAQTHLCSLQSIFFRIFWRLHWRPENFYLLYSILFFIIIQMKNLSHVEFVRLWWSAIDVSLCFLCIYELKIAKEFQPEILAPDLTFDIFLKKLIKILIICQLEFSWNFPILNYATSKTYLIYKLTAERKTFLYQI